MLEIPARSAIRAKEARSYPCSAITATVAPMIWDRRAAPVTDTGFTCMSKSYVG
ncbi:hypothetical protein GCM10017708_18530 [Arthrobacter citreus]